MANVIFKFGTRAQYEALATKDQNTLYWLSDTQELMKGLTCFGKGAAATKEAAGLMSPEDKALLEQLAQGGIFNLTPVDASVVVSDTEGGKAIGVQLSKVESNILKLKDDGLFAEIEAVPITKVTGLEERLTAVEQSMVGGVHYKGSVPTYDDLPADPKQGDLYEVAADNSEWCWNGEKWFDYGSTSGLTPVARAELNEAQFVINEQNKLTLVAVDAGIVEFMGAPMDESVPAVFEETKYEVTDGLFEDTRVLYNGKEIRVMFAKDTVFDAQEVGAGGDPNSYYFGFRAYAPEGAVGFKEDLAKTISDQTLYRFVDNPFAGTDKYGRNYSIVWLPAAALADGKWTYYGANSANGKYAGWNYSVEWYDANGKVIDSDCIRINLSNENCHNDDLPYYMSNFAKQEAVDKMEENMMWQNI